MKRLERKDRTALQPLKMADIADKSVVKRIAETEGTIWLQTGTIEKIRRGEIAKGDVLAAANTAGILAAKKTPEIIPLCHLIPLSQVDVDFAVNERSVTARCKVTGLSKTGVEMEALVGVSTALLTIWDMVKYLEKDKEGQYPHTTIRDIKIVKKIKETPK